MADQSDIAAELATEAKTIRAEIDEYGAGNHDQRRLRDLARIVERLCETVAVIAARRPGTAGRK